MLKVIAIFIPWKEEGGMIKNQFSPNAKKGLRLATLF
jgi:hypothetical protein